MNAEAQKLHNEENLSALKKFKEIFRKRDFEELERWIKYFTKETDEIENAYVTIANPDLEWKEDDSETERLVFDVALPITPKDLSEEFFTTGFIVYRFFLGKNSHVDFAHYDCEENPFESDAFKDSPLHKKIMSDYSENLKDFPGNHNYVNLDYDSWEETKELLFDIHASWLKEYKWPQGSIPVFHLD
jgi:hypothetical protein